MYPLFLDLGQTALYAEQNQFWNAYNIGEHPCWRNSRKRWGARRKEIHTSITIYPTIRRNWQGLCFGRMTKRRKPAGNVINRRLSSLGFLCVIQRIGDGKETEPIDYFTIGFPEKKARPLLWGRAFLRLGPIVKCAAGGAWDIPTSIEGQLTEKITQVLEYLKYETQHTQSPSWRKLWLRFIVVFFFLLVVSSGD